MLAEPRVLWSEDAFLARPDSLARAELLDGELVVTPSPTLGHQRVAVRLVASLEVWRERDGFPGEIAMAPLDVVFGPDLVLQPDVVVFPRRDSLPLSGEVREVPLICVEVLSPSTRGYDRITKRTRYANAGVGELWCVDPQGDVERWHGPGLAAHEVVVGVLTTPLLPGFTIDVAALRVG